MLLCLNRSDLFPQLLLMESPYRLELMFLNAGTILLMHLSTHTSTITFQSKINGEVGNVYAKQKHLGCKKMRGQSEATMVI